MLQIRHIAGDSVGKGNYWNFSNGERITMNSEGVLPGDDSAVYYRTSPLVILVAGPVLGLVYAAFLPFIGLAIIARLVIAKLFGSSAEKMSRIATFNWNPSESYLAGRRQKKGQKNESDAKSDDMANKKKE